MVEVRLIVDESYIEPGIVIIAVASFDIAEYKNFTTDRIKNKQQSHLYSQHKAHLHHQEDPKSIRTDVAEHLIRQSPISLYFLVQNTGMDRDQTQAKQITYKDCFPKVLLARIIQKFRKIHGEDCFLSISFENLSDRHDSDLKFFKDCVEVLKCENLEINIIEKSDLLTALPDYGAGILRSCILDEGKDSHSTAVVNARLVKEKIGLIAICSIGGEVKYIERGDEVDDFIGQGCPIGI